MCIEGRNFFFDRKTYYKILHSGSCLNCFQRLNATQFAGLLPFILITFFAHSSFSQTNLQPVGQWREHLPYYPTIQVVQANNEMYAATTYNVFSVDENNTITRYSKVTGLNDIGVNAIGWDSVSSQLVIGYSNSNIDVLKGRTVKNISDVKRSNISGDKTIYYVYCKNKKAYLCTGLGIVVADLDKYEIADTWIIGNNGKQVKVNGIATLGNTIYAATEDGLKSASINSNNLTDYRNWNYIVSGAIRMVMTVNDRTVILKNDSIFLQNGNSWSLLYADASWPIVNINASNGKLLVCQRTSNGSSRVLVLNTLGVIEKTLAQPNVISYPKWATLKDNEVWVADFFAGLSKFGSTVERYVPDGPTGTASGDMIVSNNTLYAAAGEVNGAWNYQYNRNGIYILKDDRWDYKGYYNTPIFDSVFDFITLATDPLNQSLWAGSYGGGLVNIAANNQIKIYKQNYLQATIGDPTSYRVSGLAFDKNSNLWISNYGAAQDLAVRKPDGSFKSFNIPFFHLENAVSQIVVDDENQLWIVSPKGNGVFIYSYGNSIESTADDNWKYFRAGAGNGNLPGNDVYCLAKDKNGFIWIGTSKGIGIVQCPEQVFTTSTCEAVLPVVQQDRFAGYLFQNEEVRAIAVDGANRKWVGTSNGIWLISPEGDKTIYRFTEDNSPLLSNDVKKITIDPATGEVYIATFKGICSFRSTATETNVTSENKVLVFPNPVPTGYNGTIAIRGVPENSSVKIAELNGRLVFETRSLGGQAVWNGRNYKGEKAASGVYLVLIKDDNGMERIATKVVIVSGR
jgi:ligand-binding sensor domain-containing protein